MPEINMAIGKVSTRAIAMLRMVDHFSPDPLAVMPDDSTCVADTGKPFHPQRGETSFGSR